MVGLAARLRTAFRRLAVVPCLLLAARIHRYRMNPAAAKVKLRRAISLSPGCFRAHLRLGALYLEENDFYQARREFLFARDLNPGKFRRLYPLITGQSGDININLFYFPGLTDREGDAAPVDFLREFIGEPLDRGGEDAVRHGDFASYREFRKFQEMGPFREEETEDVDWDDLLRKLADEEH
jgi:hypothetical protein